MDKKLDCEIVRDLLPSYVDGLTSGTTNKSLEEHLTDCEGCAALFRRMKEPEPSRNVPDAEVDYLKKVRRRTKRLGLICGILMMLAGMLLILTRFFYVGNEAEPLDMNCSISVVQNTVYVSGNLKSSTSGVARVTFGESNGIVTVTVHTAPKSFLNSNAFSEEYQTGGDITAIRCGDLILWEGGKSISPTAAQLYKAVNPYVGDMPSNGRIAGILGISDQLGPYTNALQTSQEPYGWTLILETEIAQDEESAARDIMTADSYGMLAAIGNLGYVTWQYDTPAGSQEYTVKAEEATAFAGKNIKECADSPSDLQTLLQSLSIKWSGVR